MTIFRVCRKVPTEYTIIWHYKIVAYNAHTLTLLVTDDQWAHQYADEPEYK